jgi:hypothetical protein
VILSTHDYLNTDGSRDSNGTAIWNGLVNDNCSIFLVLAGHNHAAAQRTDTNSCGDTVHQIMQNYQDEANGGNGYLRYYVFDPAADEVDVYTYSPTLDAYRTTPDEQFSFSYEMGGGPWAQVGTTQTVASGGTASVLWSGISGYGFEWYATVSDGSASTEGPHWTFSVPDTLPPVVATHEDVAVEATGPSGAVVTYTSPTATDDDPPNPAVTCLPASGSTFPMGDTTVTCSATDTAGNTGYSTFTVTVFEPGAFGLDLGSGSGYVSFGDPDKLDLAQFTIETWFKRTGAGTPYQTSGGTGGLAAAIPLVTHGASDTDGSALDANWMLVIDDTTGAIAADFEDMAAGENHAIVGTTPIPADGTWHHAAATYDGTTWHLYLDGVLEATLVVGEAPRSDSTDPSGLGAFLRTGGTPLGHFEGVLDEVRVWNYARSQAQIIADINHELTSGTGLVARWGMSEPVGATVGDSISPEADGTILGSGVSRVAGAPFDMVVDTPPDEPTLVSPPDGASGVSAPVTLSVIASDPDGGSLDVDFYGREVAGGGEPFTLAVIPDTQYYSASYPETFSAQTQWIVDQLSALNIVFVTHLGSMVSDPAVADQWLNADAAMSLLDGNVPYGVLPGNHDLYDLGEQFNSYFGPSRYAGQPWFGGSYEGIPDDYGSTNLNTWQTFEGAGMQFLILDLQHAASTAVLEWAADVIAAHPGYRVILSTHDYLNVDGTRDANGDRIWSELVYDNCSIFLVLSGHNQPAARRTDANACGYTVMQTLQSYREIGEGGMGYLRYYVFDPETDLVSVYTYSPTEDAYRTTDADQFSFSYDMSGVGPWTQVGTTQTVASGGTASVDWSGIGSGEYQWYAVVSDGSKTTEGPHWSFTASAAGGAPVVGIHPDITVMATDPSGALVTYTPPTATDDDPPNPVVTCDPASGSLFPVGDTTVTCSATDNDGLTGQSQFTVTVQAFGMLRVTTDEAVPSQILVDGAPRDTWGLTWLKLVPGDYEVSFTDVAGFTTPAPRVVTVDAWATTATTGLFAQRGYLRVVTSPAVASTILVDGVPRDDWGLWTDLPEASYEVCFGDVAGFDTPACQEVAVTPGNTTLVTGNFVANPAAPGPASDFGMLRVTTSPEVASQIVVDGVPRDTWGLNWLKLAPGDYVVSFSDVAGFTTPAPRVVTVTAGETAETEGLFVQRGYLHVTTSPAVASTILVDGLARNDWGMWTDLPAGSYQVCFGEVPGYVAPACDAGVLTAGGSLTITGTFNTVP